MANKDMVTFKMPDGTEVSNDPRFSQEKARRKALASEPYRGDEGITNEEMKAQTQSEALASLNSGQPGVGENPAPEDATRDAHGPLGSPAQQRQREDAAMARAAGANTHSTSVDEDEPVDSNERVREVRKRAAAAYKKQVDKLGDEGEGDPNKSYSDWSARQLQAEVHRRNAAGADLELKRGMRKADVAEMLERDDDNTIEEDEDEDRTSDEDSEENEE